MRQGRSRSHAASLREQFRSTGRLDPVIRGSADVWRIIAMLMSPEGEEEPVQITVVGPADLTELLPLLRAYCDFYEVAPSDRDLLELSRALLADPARAGLQLLARDDAGDAVGFATLFWTWQTLTAARVGVMNDLFVTAAARGAGVAEGLIAACLERCREHGATRLVWQTAVDNHRAQAVYARVGATREDRWLDYWLPVEPA
jgi:GNAT superfamily N-acetyltransferase